MSDQGCSTKARPYRQRRRAEHVEETRRRITDAAIRLHTTVGPSATSIAAVAQEAGVTRLTVYRHFADLDALFEACRHDWRARNQPPDPRAWGALTDLEARARSALGELYDWYEVHARELAPIYRDAAMMPASAWAATTADMRALADAVLADDAPDGPSGVALRAVARHLVDFRTWQSLVHAQGLDQDTAVDVATRWLTGLLGPSRRPRCASDRS